MKQKVKEEVAEESPRFETPAHGARMRIEDILTPAQITLCAQHGYFFGSVDQLSHVQAQASINRAHLLGIPEAAKPGYLASIEENLRRAVFDKLADEVWHKMETEDDKNKYMTVMLSALLPPQEEVKQ